MPMLQRVPSHSATWISADTYPSNAQLVIDRYAEPLPNREIELHPITVVMDKVQNLSQITDVQKLDGWLATRVHAALPLTRREASDRGIWRFLAAYYPEYVMMRWLSKDKKDQARISGTLNRQAFSRLWWQAELTRNGDDYSPVPLSFRSQEVSNWILDSDAFQKRAAAIAYLRFLDELGVDFTDSRARTLARNLNHVLTVTPLDVLAPNSAWSPSSIRDWINHVPDGQQLVRDELPLGPSDTKVDEATVERVMGLLKSINERIVQTSEESVASYT